MYDIELKGVDNIYEYEELVKVFLKPSEYRLSVSGGAPRDKREVARELYNSLSSRTGKRQDWGTLTGVRPVKLAGELCERVKNREKAVGILTGEYLLSREKAELIVSIYEYQREKLKRAPDDTTAVYIGIPFCPTRCLYCSFASNSASGSDITAYLDALFKEIDIVSGEMKRLKMKAETLYIGGGTPTCLSPAELEKLLLRVCDSFDIPAVREFTVEAGRPDTITEEKARLIKAAGAHRICVNPQSMNAKTLGLIGRSHTEEDVISAFEMARREGISTINMDIIAGLPEESADDFADTLKRCMDLEPENITVHSLAVKRASRLIDADSEYHYEHGGAVGEMLSGAKYALTAGGYTPYYLYRLKHTAGGSENTGWCKPGTECVYNIRVMEEKQTVIALGAGGITKVFYPAENRLERAPNVTNYEVYISRIDEMLERKREKLFNRRENDVDKRA